MKLIAALLLALSIGASAVPRHVEPEMSWLDNGTIRLGVDLHEGGAITYLSRSGDELNVINSWDLGRQVQMSFYSGPVPYAVGDKKPQPVWEHIGWNPIQVGDDFGHPAKVLVHENDGKRIYLKCIPMQWPLDDVPGECTFESWIELDGAAARVHGRINNARTDHTQFRARGQELPAVYTNGPFYRLFSYTGAKPFTHEPAVQLVTKAPPTWNQWMATENWSALVNDAGWGLGVWNPGCVRFGGGFAGKSGTGGPHDDPCGYIAPGRTEILDWNIVYDFHYELILGSLEEIRARVYRDNSSAPSAPAWSFQNDRQGWTYVHASDAGWPIEGELKVRWNEEDPFLMSPEFFFPAPHGAVVRFTAALGTRETNAQLYWATSARPGFNEENSIHFPVTADGAYREYQIEIPAEKCNSGLLQIRIDPANHPEGEMRLKSVRIEAGKG